MLLSRNSPEKQLQSIFDCTKGIVFMGTPHRGSWMAECASAVRPVVGLAKSTNRWLLDILKADNQLLESVQVEFWNMIRLLREEGRSICITCVYEELPLPGFRKAIVPKKSATQEGYHSFSIHADHREMVRFSSEEDAGFKRLLGNLKDWLKDIDVDKSGKELTVDSAC